MKMQDNLKAIQQTETWKHIIQCLQMDKQELMNKVDMYNPNNSHFLMAQIKTIERFINYPDVLIERLNIKEQIEEDAAKEKLYNNLGE